VANPNTEPIQTLDWIHHPSLIENNQLPNMSSKPNIIIVKCKKRNKFHSSWRWPEGNEEWMKKNSLSCHSHRWGFDNNSCRRTPCVTKAWILFSCRLLRFIVTNRLTFIRGMHWKINCTVFQRISSLMKTLCVRYLMDLNNLDSIYSCETFHRKQ
jgi:hypothetical protein